MKISLQKLYTYIFKYFLLIAKIPRDPDFILSPNTQLRRCFFLFSANIRILFMRKYLSPSSSHIHQIEERTMKCDMIFLFSPTPTS